MVACIALYIFIQIHGLIDSPGYNKRSATSYLSNLSSFTPELQSDDYDAFPVIAIRKSIDDNTFEQINDNYNVYISTTYEDADDSE
jgi:hypothetical protein